MPRALLGLLLALAVLAKAAAAQERLLLVGGNYRLRFNLHTMQDGFFGAPQPEGEVDTQSFLDTRLRLFFDLRPHPLLRLNYKLEIGDITFGAAGPPLVDAEGRRLVNVGRSSGGGPGADAVNVETKNAYLDVQLPWLPGLSFRGGILGWGDQFDWTILATDFTGFQVTYTRQALWAQFTFLKFAEGSLRRGDDSDWFALDTRFGLAPRTALGASFYFWNDNANDNPASGRDAYQLYAGLKLSTTILGKGLLEVAGVYNRGQEFLGQTRRQGPDGLVRGGLTGSRNQGFLAQLHFDYPLGRHWLGLTLQYLSGEAGSRAQLDGSGKDIDAFLSLFNSQYSGFGLSRFSEGGGLELLTFGQLNDSTAGLNNVSVSPFFGGGYNGRILAVLRSKFRLTPVVFLFGAVGLDWAAQQNINGETFRGAELATYLHWDLFPKLWLRLGGAFLLTGPWWDNNPDLALQGFPDPLGLESEGKMGNILQLILRLQYDFG
ncbi:MAG: hypothetical protein KatS3mg131_2108 [Candidatus Tectimicrobiota bacterium]|nr:MAG: hypothetical protein KatS3mg131_2108 [Candidatus Tectomicrobia bacterium]